MSHIQHLARKRNVVQFFGTDCMVEKMAHEALERQRVDDENAILRAENAGLRNSLSEALQSLHAAAAKLDELMKREAALVAALEQDGRRLCLREVQIAILQGEIDAHIEASRTTKDFPLK